MLWKLSKCFIRLTNTVASVDDCSMLTSATIKWLTEITFVEVGNCQKLYKTSLNSANLKPISAYTESTDYSFMNAPA